MNCKDRIASGTDNAPQHRSSIRHYPSMAEQMPIGDPKAISPRTHSAKSEARAIFAPESREASGDQSSVNPPDRHARKRSLCPNGVLYLEEADTTPF